MRHMLHDEIEILEGEIVNDPPPPSHPIFLFVTCPPAGMGNRVGGEKRRPSDRELLREWVSQARPLVLKPIASMERVTMKDYKFDDENDASWLDWQGAALLIAAGVFSLLAALAFLG